jgi:hypothetical protein
MAATLKLAGEIRQQTNKARLFAEAVVTGLRRVRRSFAENEGARTTESRDQLIDATGEELDDLLAAALLVVENLGGGDAQRTRGGSKGPPGSDTLPK